jgi:predicted nucleic acid-binding protein
LARLDREIRIESLTKDELHRTMQIARHDGLVFYDAAYLPIAERESIALVTGDTALRNAADQQGIPVGSINGLG